MYRYPMNHLFISIHALCEEGDADNQRRGGQPVYFYPRPLRGGRPATGQMIAVPDNFYPRPLRGGRLSYDDETFYINVFLSTPSARRATC